MNSITLRIKKGNGRPHRAYDYLYDPVYTVSSHKDHARSSFNTYASMDRVRKVQEFRTMFSDLPHHPRYTLRLDATDPVPAFVNRQWHGHIEQHRDALQQLAGIIPGVNSHFQTECHVTGADRSKFFQRPLIPFPQQVPLDVVFARPKAIPHASAAQQPTPFERTVGVQTDYRESEMQTHPYTPEYVVRPGMGPSELRTLASLTWGRGLPAGLADVEMIERARSRREWEATLPPLNDLSQLNKRRRMMREMEAKEWAIREEEIQELQEARLGILWDLLREREEANTKRQQQKYSQFQSDKDRKRQKIQIDYMRSLRKLTANRSNVEGKLKHRDIVKDYVDNSSQVYAPRTCSGVFPDHNIQNNVVKSHYLDTYEGLLELQAELPASLTELRVKASKPKTNKGYLTRSECYDLILKKTYQALKEEKAQVLQKKTSRFLVKKEMPVPHCPTPCMDEPPEGEEERELAVIHLQKLLRGRSIQYQMFEAKERCKDLIKEIKTTHALQREEQNILKDALHRARVLQTRRDLQRYKTFEAEANQTRLIGAELTDLFNTLSKELIHLHEERRLHAFSLLAERERRIREAEESGQRQVEEQRSREEEEIFRKMVHVHQDTVDSYLEDIILNTTEQTADQQAREEIRRFARKVNDHALGMGECYSVRQSQEIVSELVHSFLIPEVKKICNRERVRQLQRKHLLAARQIIREAAHTPGASEAPKIAFSSNKDPEGLLEEVSQLEQEEK